MLFITGITVDWVYQGLEKMHMVFISVVGTVALQCGAVLIFVKGPKDLLAVPVINFLTALLVVGVLIGRLQPSKFFRVEELRKIGRYLKNSTVIWMISLCAQAYNSLDIVILGLFRSPVEVGLFTVARRIASGVSIFIVFLANSILPRLSASFVSDRSEFAKATRRFIALSIVVLLLLFIPMIIWTRAIIVMTVGKDYLSAVAPLRILLIALILVLFNIPFSTGLVAAGYERQVLKQVIASAALSVISNFILIPRYGMIGAGISFVAAEALALVWIIVVYRRKLVKEGVPNDREK